MNKKLFFGWFAASMLFATSCSNDELEAVQSGNEAQVTFSLGLEGAIGSRAISDGTGADVLMYAVFDKDGKRISTIDKVRETGVTFPTTKKITLAKGQTYKVAFWAQDDDCEAYTVSDDMNVTVNYANEKNQGNNDETRDAFFKTVEFTVTGSTSIDVELKRPFAQINVGVTKADWDAAVASGITIAKSSVVIKNAATSLNLLNGTVGEETADVSYVLNTIPNEFLKVDTDGNGEKEDYYWLSMSYILPAAQTTGYESTTLDNVSFVFAPSSGEPIKFNQGLNAVPVQRNWRTNILGKILTGDIQFNITIDPVYDNDINYPNGSAQELELAAKMGGSVTLTEDVKLTAPLEVVADMVLDLNGKKITTTLKEEGRHHYAINNRATMILKGEKGSIEARGIQNFGTMTIDGDITITNVDTNGGAAVWNEGTLTINGGTFTTNENAGIGSYGAALNTRPSGTAIVNGGNFTAYSQLSYAIINEGTTTINDAMVKGKHGAVAGSETNDATVINGGTFELMENSGVSDHCTYYCSEIRGGKFTLGENTDSGAQVFYESKIATGFKFIENNGICYVVADDVDVIAATQEELASAIQANSTILLSAGNYTFPAISAEGVTLVCEEGTVFEGNSKLNINGATVIGATFSNPSGDASSGTINGTFKKCTFSGSNASRWTYAKNSDIVFEDCVFNANGVYAIHYDGTTGANILYKNCKITGWVAIAGGHKSLTFDGCQIYGNGTYGVIRVYGDTTIKNCTFDVAKVNTSDAYQDGIHAVDCTITVENCVNVNGEIDNIFNVSGTGVINKN